MSSRDANERDDDDEGLARELPADGPTPEQSLMRERLMQAVKDCLGELDARDRFVVLGRREGLKLRDLATQLDCTPQRVAQIEQRGCKKLRKCLEARLPNRLSNRSRSERR